MSAFIDEISAWKSKFSDLGKKERDLKTDAEILNRDFQAYLRRIGLPEQFSVADLMDLVAKRATE